MREAIEKIVDVSRLLKITQTQALFLIAYREGIYSVVPPGEELIDLIQRGFLKGNRPTTEAMERLENCFREVEKVEIERVKVNSQYPIITTETGELVKTLAKHFHKGKLTAKEFERLSAYNKNPYAIPFLFIFLNMFPTADRRKNEDWIKHFGGENASAVTLRRLTAGTARKFQQIWKKKDIGLFLLGTYLCIKESYNEDAGKYYVKSMENFLKEWEHWYQQAEDLLEAGELNKFTKRETGKSNSSNTVVI